MYTEYWNLTAMPFDNAADSAFFFQSSGHQEAITRMSFGIQTHKAIVVVTGDYGAGKTMVCETVVKRLPANQYKVAYITNPRMDSIDLTREIVFQLGDDVPSRSNYEVFHALNNLLDRHAATGKHCVAIVDEAQNIMNQTVLEDLRLLLNHQVNGRLVLTLVLVGQTEFGDMLRSIPQMVQRIGLKFHIPHLQAEEVGKYMAHRLEVAGGSLAIFEPAAIQEIASVSKGNPREINALADLCLLVGALTGKKTIGIEDVLEARKERA